jgi:iron complex transport system substrate-binding protein
MKKVICALGMVFASVGSALATTYPLTIENCGYKETFTKSPERVVALGQNTVEILLLLGLQDKVGPAHSGRPKSCRNWLNRMQKLKR